MITKKDYALKEAKWLTDIPKDWHPFRLKEVAKVSPPCSGDGPKIGEKCSVIPMEAVTKKGYFNDYDLQEQEYELISSGLPNFENGDVIFAKITPCMENGKGAFVESLKTKYAFGSTEFHVFRPNHLIHGKFLYYYTYNSEYRKYAAENMTGAAGQKRVSTRFVQYTPVFLSDISGQKRVSNYLNRQCGAIDKVINIKKEQLIILEDLRKSIIYKAIAKGLDESVECVDSGNESLGKIPKHWKFDRIKDLTTKIGSGITPEGGAMVYVDEGIPLLRSQNIHFDGLKMDDVAFITDQQHSEMVGTHVQPGDVLLNITGASIGRCYYVTDELGPSNVNQHVCIIRPCPKLQAKFLYYFLSSSIGQGLILSCWRGASRQGLGSRELMSFVLPVPPFEEQSRIVEYLEEKNSEIHSLISNIENQIGTLEKYRASLIHECVTGKLRITEKDLKEFVNV